MGEHSDHAIQLRPNSTQHWRKHHIYLGISLSFCNFYVLGHLGFSGLGTIDILLMD